MTEPERLLSSPDPDIRRALQSDAALSPPPGAEQAVWAALAGAVAAGSAAAGASAIADAAGAGTSASAGAVASTGAVTVSGAVKSLALGVGLGLVVAGGVVAGERLFQKNGVASARPSVLSSVPSRARTKLPPHPSSQRVGVDVRDLPLESAPASRHVEALPSSAPAARDESALVLEASRALREGEPSLALQILNEARRSFGRGKLGQEREALEIDALSAWGANDEAAEMARAFLARYPESPHAARMRDLLTRQRP